MKYNEFYREPTAKLLFASPLNLVELSARNCYDSFQNINIDLGKLIDNEKYKLEDCFPKQHKVYEYIDVACEITPSSSHANMIEEDIKNNNEWDVVKQEFIDSGVIFDYPEYIIPNTKFIREVGINRNHSSILEHATLHFRLGFPRNVLQEISRHRVGVSPSIKSTRYTLTELRKLFIDGVGNGNATEDINAISEYIHKNYGLKAEQSISDADDYLFCVMESFYKINDKKLTNDFLKNILPEHWWTSGHYTINLRAFKHMMELRLNKSAFMPFRRLAFHMYNELPDQYMEIFQDDFKENLENINTKWNNEDM